jgi:hypothetical protein
VYLQGYPRDPGVGWCPSWVAPKYPTLRRRIQVCETSATWICESPVLSQQFNCKSLRVALTRLPKYRRLKLVRVHVRRSPAVQVDPVCYVHVTGLFLMLVVRLLLLSLTWSIVVCRSSSRFPSSSVSPLGRSPSQGCGVRGAVPFVECTARALYGRRRLPSALLGPI